MGSVDLLRFLVFPLLSASSPRALNDAFFSLRVREVAASGLRGEDTAGRCSSSRRVVGRAERAVIGEGCWISAIATGFGRMKLHSKMSVGPGDGLTHAGALEVSARFCSAQNRRVLLLVSSGI